PGDRKIGEFSSTDRPHRSGRLGRIAVTAAEDPVAELWRVYPRCKGQVHEPLSARTRGLSADLFEAADSGRPFRLTDVHGRWPTRSSRDRRSGSRERRVLPPAPL